MNKLMQFDANVRDVFDNDEAKYESFNKLMLDVANNSLEEGISLKEANAKITQKFREITGPNEGSSRRKSVPVPEVLRKSPPDPAYNNVPDH